jgi:hypothetical protein
MNPFEEISLFAFGAGSSFGAYSTGTHFISAYPITRQTGTQALANAVNLRSLDSNIAGIWAVGQDLRVLSVESTAP